MRVSNVAPACNESDCAATDLLARHGVDPELDQVPEGPEDPRRVDHEAQAERLRKVVLHRGVQGARTQGAAAAALGQHRGAGHMDRAIHRSSRTCMMSIMNFMNSWSCASVRDAITMQRQPIRSSFCEHCTTPLCERWRRQARRTMLLNPKSPRSYTMVPFSCGRRISLRPSSKKSTVYF